MARLPFDIVQQMVLPFAYALGFFFGSITILNTLSLEFFYYFPRTIHISILTPSIDLWIWFFSILLSVSLSCWPLVTNNPLKSLLKVILASSALLLLALTYFLGDSAQNLLIYGLFLILVSQFLFSALYYPRSQEEGRGLLLRTVTYLVAEISTIEVSSATHFVIRAFDPYTAIGSFDASIDLQLSYASYPLLPFLCAAFLTSWFWVPGAQRLLKVIRPGKVTEMNDQRNDERLWWTATRVIADPKFFALLGLGFFVAYYSYLHNPPWLVGTDAYWRYYDPLVRMNSSGVIDGFGASLREWHPAGLMILYALQLLSHSTPFDVIKDAQVFVVLASAFAAWWFLVKLDTSSLGWAVLVTSFLSVTTTVGMWTGVLTNLIALLVWILFLGYASFRHDRGLRAIDAIVLLCLSLIILFVHSWTWGVFSASIIVSAVLIVVFMRNDGRRLAATLVSVTLCGALVAYLSLSVLSRSEGGQVANAISLYTVSLRKPASVLFFWQALNRLIQVWSAFFCPLYVSLSILGVFYLHRFSPQRRYLIFGWLFVAAVGSLLVAPIGFDPSQPTASESQLWRLFLLTPFQLTAPLGIIAISELPRKLQGVDATRTTRNVPFPNRWVLPAAIGSIGAILPFALLTGRFIAFLLILPMVTAFILARNMKRTPTLASDLLFMLLILIGFNYTTRALSQLLVDPHNYRP